MDWNTFVTTLTATGFASATFVFLAKILSKHLLSMDLERFKAELRSNNEKELEQLKTDLRIAAFQKETTFASLHEKRAAIIAELYVKLDAAHRAMTNLLKFGELKGESLSDKAWDALDDFNCYYNIHQIYFEESLCALLLQFSADIYRAKNTYNPEFYKTDMVGQVRENLNSKYQLKYLYQHVPPIRKEIETTFRKLLGLSASSTTPFKAEEVS